MIPHEHGKDPPTEVDPTQFDFEAFVDGPARFELLELSNGNFARIDPEGPQTVTLAIYHDPDQPWIEEPRSMAKDTAKRLLEAHGGVVRRHLIYE